MQGKLSFFTRPHGGSDTERMRIDSTGKVLVGGTAQADATSVTLNPEGYIYAKSSHQPAAFFDRDNSDGDIVILRKNGTAVGSIGVAAGPVAYMVFNETTSDNVAALKGASGAILPSTNAGADKDGTMNLGSSGARFESLYLSGTIALTTADNASAANIFVSPSTDFLYLEHPSNGMIFRNTSGSERMRIDSSGRVGIGTSSPSKLLTVHYDAPAYDTVDDVLRLVSKFTSTANAASALVGSGPAIVFAGGIGDNQTRDRARIVGVYEGFNQSGLSFHTQDTADIITEKMRLTSAANGSRLGIGTSSPASKLHVQSTTSDGVIVRTTTNVEPFIALQRNSGSNGVAVLRSIDGGDLRIDTGATGAAQTTKMTVEAGGNVGIGTTAPSELLEVKKTTANAIIKVQTGGGYDARLILDAPAAGGAQSQIFFDADGTTAGSIMYQHNSGGTNYMTFGTGGSNTERMRIDSSGNVLVGTTDDAPGAGNTLSGVAIRGGSDNRSFFSASSNYVAAFNRNTNDGPIVEFNKNGTTVGNIGVQGGANLLIGNGDTGIRFAASNNAIHPWNTSTLGLRDAAIDLGADIIRFKDLYLSGTANVGAVIATGNVTAYSDRNLKENIEPILNAVEKVQQLNGVTYNRNDLEDTTKRYAGIIAQDLQAVLPEAVEGDSILRVDYNATIGLLIEAIKELKTEVDDLKTKLKEVTK
jgi:hypothetical protein